MRELPARVRRRPGRRDLTASGPAMPSVRPDFRGGVPEGGIRAPRPSRLAAALPAPPPEAALGGGLDRGRRARRREHVGMLPPPPAGLRTRPVPPRDCVAALVTRMGRWLRLGVHRQSRVNSLFAPGSHRRSHATTVLRPSRTGRAGSRTVDLTLAVCQGTAVSRRVRKGARVASVKVVYEAERVILA